MAQLADDTIAELEAMKSEIIHLSSETVKYDGELQAAKQALQQLTTALEVTHPSSKLVCFSFAHLSRMCLGSICGATRAAHVELQARQMRCHPCSKCSAPAKTHEAPVQRSG